MNHRLLSLFCNLNETPHLGDDFILIEEAKLMALEGRMVKSESYIVLHCLSGEMRFSIGAQSLTISEGHVTCLLIGQVYEIHHVSRGFKANILLFSDHFIEGIGLKSNLFFNTHSGRMVTAAIHGSFKQFTDICKDIIRFDINTGKAQIIQLLTKAYLLRLSHEKNQTEERSQSNHASSNITQRYLTLLQSENTIHRSIEYYANVLHITSRHLSFCCRECTGHSALHWLNQTTILEAKNLLAGSNLSVAEIASRLGFSNQSVFGRHFKRHSGLAPMDYRKKDDEF